MNSGFLSELGMITSAAFGCCVGHVGCCFCHVFAWSLVRLFAIERIFVCLSGWRGSTHSSCGICVDGGACPLNAYFKCDVLRSKLLCERDVSRTLSKCRQEYADGCLNDTVLWDVALVLFKRSTPLSSIHIPEF